MWRLKQLGLLSVTLALSLVVAGGCKRKERLRVETVEEPTSPGTLSVLQVADPRAATQLLKGFYDVEQNAWRWTQGKFSVTLRPPTGAAQKGATLIVKMAVPDPVIAKLNNVTLTANVNGTALAGEKYTKPGEYTYAREVPAAALAAEAVTIEFALDKAMAPAGGDQRELGIIVSMIGFEAK